MALLGRKFAHPGIEEPRSLHARLVGIAGLWRREVAVSKAPVEDRLSGRAVKVDALRLLVLLIPREVEPAKAFEDGIERGFGVALDIGVVDAQDHGPAVAAGEEPIKDESARAPDVEKARGGGRKTDSRHENKSIAAGADGPRLAVLVYSAKSP